MDVQKLCSWTSEVVYGLYIFQYYAFVLLHFLKFDYIPVFYTLHLPLHSDWGFGSYSESIDNYENFYFQNKYFDFEDHRIVEMEKSNS